MSYQLPPLNDEYQFEMLVRDLLRRVYDDPGVERFGRRGQAQHGIDGFSPADSDITFQCKLKDVRYETDERLRKQLLAEMEVELEETKGLARRPRRFIFASTFKNDTHLQQKAVALSDESLTVEYWGWDTINERIWDYAEFLLPVYYPDSPVRRVSGFRQVSLDYIAEAQTGDVDELNKLAIEYYRINDRGEVVFRVVCNDLDVRNDTVMEQADDRLEALTGGGTLWILGDGGCGKTTILHRLSVELARRARDVYTLNLETHLAKADVEAVLSWIRYRSTSGPAVLCIDNPAADEETLETLLRQIPDHCPGIQILLAERAHRYHALRRAGCLTHLHGEEEDSRPVFVRNTRRQRQKVYGRFFELLGLSDADTAGLREIALDERLVYVNATYSILLELKKKRRIDFDFDWDDFGKLTSDLPAFRESYKYIALFYLFGVRTPFTVLSRVFGADTLQQRAFLERFRGLVNEPIIIDERRDESFRKSVYVRTKHEIVSEIFFLEHPELDKDELLREWCESTDFGDALKAQPLINLLGAKKNYAGDNPLVNFRGLIDFLLDGYLYEKVARSPKLNATTHLAKFWSLLLQDKPGEAIAVLESFLQKVPGDLHSRTELAKAYQKQGKLAEAETLLLKVLEIRPEDLNGRLELAKIYQRQGRLDEAAQRAEEALAIDPLNNHAISELLGIWRRQGDKEKCAQRFLKFIAQPGYVFSRYSQAPVFRFFQCCRAFEMKEYADQIFKRYESELDEQNREYYLSNF